MRHPVEERVLWIDALCINQADRIEKTYQVGLMTEIYRNAWRSLAWLGEFEEDAVLKPNMTLEAYRQSGVTMHKNHAHTAFRFVEKVSTLSKEGHFTVEEDSENLQPGWVSVTESDVTAVQELMNLKWWTRVWTVQECVLPRRVELRLGTLSCEDALSLLASKSDGDMWKHDPLYGRCCETVFTRLPQFPALFHYFYNRMPCLRKINRRLPLSLGDSISRFRYRQCEDPRDKVFGLLGLTHPEARQLVDYRLDKTQVYTKFIRYDITSTNTLRPLMRLSELCRDTSLPSWVPDLEAEVLDDPRLNILELEMKYISACPDIFGAGTQRSVELGVSREDELFLGGRRVDTIIRICKGPARTLWQNGGDARLMPQFRARWRSLLEDEPSLDLSSYPSGGTYEESFWRTCTCDVYVSRSLDNRARRLTAEDEERVEAELATGAYGSGITPTTTFFISHHGYIGVGPEDTRVGDAVYVLFGGHVPFILRDIPEAHDTGGSHNFVGHAYVHGIMDGEALHTNIPDETVMIV